MHICIYVYIYIYIYIYICIYLYVTGMEKGLKKSSRFGAFVIIGGSNMDAGWFADEPWQFQCACSMVFPPEIWSIWSWCHHVMALGSLMLWKGGNYKRRVWLNLRAVDTLIWVFWYKVFGLVSKPQTLYFSYLGALWEGSIIRTNISTYLSIFMHPDLSGGLSVSTTSVLWQQWGR